MPARSVRDVGDDLTRREETIGLGERIGELCAPPLRGRTAGLKGDSILTSGPASSLASQTSFWDSAGIPSPDGHLAICRDGPAVELRDGREPPKNLLRVDPEVSAGGEGLRLLRSDRRDGPDEAAPTGLGRMTFLPGQ